MEKSLEKFLEESLKSEKGVVKKRLLKWGASLNMCDMKQEEILKLKRLMENGTKIYVNDNFELLDKTVIDRYEKEINYIYEYIEGIMDEKRKMDLYISELEPTEQEFIYLKYRKGYDFNFVANKMNVSRSQVFRIKDFAIDKLISIKKKYENEIF